MTKQNLREAMKNMGTEEKNIEESVKKNEKSSEKESKKIKGRHFNSFIGDVLEVFVMLSDTPVFLNNLEGVRLSKRHMGVKPALSFLEEKGYVMLTDSERHESNFKESCFKLSAKGETLYNNLVSHFNKGINY